MSFHAGRPLSHSPRSQDYIAPFPCVFTPRHSSVLRHPVSGTTGASVPPTGYRIDTETASVRKNAAPVAKRSSRETTRANRKDRRFSPEPHPNEAETIDTRENPPASFGSNPPDAHTVRQNATESVFDPLRTTSLHSDTLRTPRHRSCIGQTDGKHLAAAARSRSKRNTAHGRFPDRERFGMHRRLLRRAFLRDEEHRAPDPSPQRIRKWGKIRRAPSLPVAAAPIRPARHTGVLVQSDRRKAGGGRTEIRATPEDSGAGPEPAESHGPGPRSPREPEEKFLFRFRREPTVFFDILVSRNSA